MNLIFAVLLLLNPTEPPAAYVTPAGEYAGTNVDLAKAVAAELGEPLEIEVSSFDRMIPRLKEGTADMAISGITITEPRKRDVDFSIPYGQAGCAFLYFAGKPRPRMSHLASERIGVELDTLGDMYLSRHGCDPIRYVGMDACLKGLEEGDVDAIFFDEEPLKVAAAASNGRYVVSPLETREGYGIAVNKRRPDVLKAANAAIAKRKAAAK